MHLPTSRDETHSSVSPDRDQTCAWPVKATPSGNLGVLLGMNDAVLVVRREEPFTEQLSCLLEELVLFM